MNEAPMRGLQPKHSTPKQLAQAETKRSDKATCAMRDTLQGTSPRRRFDPILHSEGHDEREPPPKRDTALHCTLLADFFSLSTLCVIRLAFRDATVCYAKA